MRYKEWRIASPNQAARAVLEQAGIPPLAAAILSARGICSADEVQAFLHAQDRPVRDGGQMKDMDRAEARVRLALERGEHMAVYGDYDVDGITATCLLTQYLSDCGGHVTPYIPDRLEEGYGLNESAVSSLKAQGVTLIITVDCGITAVEEAQWISELGLDLVITDHHECKEQLPDACAVVDPHRPDCPYPFKGLAGVGVALKLCMALAGPERAPAVLDEFADLAAIGTVADVMPMVDENRTIVLRGLRRLAGTRRQGLAALIREAGMNERPLTSVSIGYALAPRINAAGRMGCARIAVDLLMSQDEAQAAFLARELCRLNRERQEVESEIFAQCRTLLRDEPPQHAIVLADPSWHQGVVGIVASRLTEQYGCPSFMICLSDGMGKGSCRSNGAVNLFSVLEGCQDLLEGFGGHEQAAGFTVKEKNVLALAQRIRTQVAAQSGSAAAPALAADVLLEDASLLNAAGVEFLERLEPYGGGNPRPMLVLTGAQVVSRALVGSGRHLKMKLMKAGAVLDAIFFSSGDALPPVGSRIDVAFCPQINEYRGARTVQLQLADLRPSSERGDEELELYRRFLRGDELTGAQARQLLPAREEFVALWRYMKQQADGRGSLARTARQIVRDVGAGASLAHMMICLDVLTDCSLISLSPEGDLLHISLLPVEEKADLDMTQPMLRLRRMIQAGA